MPWPMNNVEDRLCDSGEDPVNDARVNLASLDGVLLRWGQGPNVTLDAECDEHGVEEAAPLAIVGLIDVQSDRDMGANGDSLEEAGSTETSSLEEE